MNDMIRESECDPDPTLNTIRELLRVLESAVAPNFQAQLASLFSIAHEQCLENCRMKQ